MPRGKLNPNGNARDRKNLDKKLARTQMRGNHPRTMTRVSEKKPDPQDEVMKPGQTYGCLIFKELVFNKSGGEELVLHKASGIMRVPRHTTAYFEHKEPGGYQWYVAAEETPIFVQTNNIPVDKRTPLTLKDYA